MISRAQQRLFQVAKTNQIKGTNGSFMRALSTKEMYTERQARLGRPVSPHVTIYAFPITAISSIVVRVTGSALAAGFVGIGALGAVGADVPGLVHCAQNVIPGFTPLSKFIVAFPLSYHYLGGMRHLVWDNAPKLLSTAQVAPTSYGILAAATVFSLGVSMYTISSDEEEK